MTTFSETATLYDEDRMSTYTAVVSGSFTTTLTSTALVVTFGNLTGSYDHPRGAASVKLQLLSADDGYVITDTLLEGSMTWAPSTAVVSIPRTASTQTFWPYLSMLSHGFQLATLTVPALPSYAVAYYANGGQGAPSAQTKLQGTDLVLSSTAPTREDHQFEGWGLTQTATEPSYQPGDTYSADEALNLYAIWVRTYSAPVISSVDAYRCDSSGVAADEGAYAAVEIAWSMWATGNTGTLTATVNSHSATKTVTGSAGSSKLVVAAAMSADSEYSVSVTFADSLGGASRAASKSASIGTAFITMDVLAGGHGISFGAPATGEWHDIEMPPYVYGRYDLPVYEYDSLPAESSLPLTPCIVVLTTGEVYLAS